MPTNTQPCILTVCVPGSATDRGELELNEILSRREQAASVPRCGALASDDDSSGVKCDACDDSACGIDPTGDFAHQSSVQLTGGLSDRLVHADGAKVCNSSFFHADSGKKALELLRMLHFDLLVTGDQLPDMPVSHFIRRVRGAWPWQKWAMVGSAITTQDEIAARTLGAVAVFDAPADWEAISSLAATAAAGKAAAASASVVSSGAQRAGWLRPAASRASAMSARKAVAV
jgi:hypothetical protein